MESFLIEMKEGMVNRGEGIPQRHNTIEVLMMCVNEQSNLCCYLLEKMNMLILKQVIYR